jgi:phenylacetate-CoA ligase
MLAEISYESAKPIIKERMLKQMRKILKEKQLEYVDFNVRFVDAILPDKVTGKKKLIVKQEDFL